MSPTMSDELLVRRLAERVDRALPPMALGPGEVLGAGRRHRRRRMTVRVVGGLAVASVATFGALQLSGGRTPLPPGDVVQEPRPFGDGQTLEVAPGVIAANRPAAIHSADGSLMLLDLGFTTPGPGSTISGPVFEQPLVLAPLPADQLPPDEGVLPPQDAGVLFTHYSESGGLGARGHPLRWGSRDSAVYDVVEALTYSSLLELEFEDGSALRAGAVPPWLTDPRVYLYSEIQGAEGTDGTAVELPTFRYDLADERLLFAAQLTTVDPPSTYATVFVGGDGEVVLGNGLCAGWTLETCDPDQARRIADAVGVDLDDDPAAPEPETGTLPAGLVEVAPGVVAAARPTERVMDDGSLALILGLRAGDDPAARELAVVHNPRTGIWTPYGSGEVWVSRDVTLDIALLEGTDVKEALFWEDWGRFSLLITDAEREFWGPGVEDGSEAILENAPNPHRLADDEGWATVRFFDDRTTVVVGLVPADADPDALAQVTLREPITGPEGRPTTVLRLPTFEAPTADGRRMFAATIDSTVGLWNTPDWQYPLERIPVPLVDADD